MLKLKKEIINLIYIAIITTMICALMWSEIEWRTVVGITINTIIITAGLLDKRYERFFE